MNDTSSFYAKDRAALRNWLVKNHASEQSVWLVFDKGKDRTLTYDDIVEEVLCFGWIDSRPGKVSETQGKLYLSKRKAQSAWSKINKERVSKLTEAGLMQASGLEAVKIAQANGNWDALNKSDNLEMPAELQVLFAENPRAQSFYESIAPSSKKIILEWIYSAKKEETKQARIRQTVELAAQGIKANHYR